MKKILLTLLAIVAFLIVFGVIKYNLIGLGSVIVQTGIDEENLTEHPLVGKRVVFNEPRVYAPCPEDDNSCSKSKEWKKINRWLRCVGGHEQYTELRPRVDFSASFDQDNFYKWLPSDAVYTIEKVVQTTPEGMEVAFSTDGTYVVLRDKNGARSTIYTQDNREVTDKNIFKGCNYTNGHMAVFRLLEESDVVSVILKLREGYAYEDKQDNFIQQLPDDLNIQNIVKEPDGVNATLGMDVDRDAYIYLIWGKLPSGEDVPVKSVEFVDDKKFQYFEELNATREYDESMGGWDFSSYAEIF